MSITYTKKQRKRAETRRLPLVTLAYPGFQFQGPVSPDEAKRISEFVMQFLERRVQRLLEEPAK